MGGAVGRGGFWETAIRKSAPHEGPEGGRGPKILLDGVQRGKGERARLMLDQQQRQSIMLQAPRR